MTPVLSIELAYRVAAGLLGVSTLIAGIEYATIRREFTTGSFFDWKLLRTEFRWASTGRLADVLDEANRLIPLVVVAKIASASAMIALAVASTDNRGVWVAVLGVQFATCMLLNVRTLYGLDGSDQLTILILGALLIGFAAPETHTIRVLAAWFVAGQLGLAYAAAGVAKAVSVEWRSGTALVGIVGTEMYGMPSFYRWLDSHPMTNNLLARLVIVFECLFVLLLLASPETAFVAFGIALLFHLGCAVVMGLNTFLWAFVAAYPLAFATAGQVNLVAWLR